MRNYLQPGAWAFGGARQGWAIQMVSTDARGICAQYGGFRGAAVYAIVGGGDV
jgi:hypothetical protein